MFTFSQINRLEKMGELAFGIADAVQVVHTDARIRDGILDNFKGPLSMMYSCVAGKETFTGRGDVGMPNV
jgi:hypothetical protein